MPINNNPNTKVNLYCPECDGEAENCSHCNEIGLIQMTVEEWMNKNIKSNCTDEGIYSFNDMVKAFELGVLAESGDFPSQDYIGGEKVIQKYFKSIE